MSLQAPNEVYTAREIAHAARVPERLVESLLARGEVRTVAAFLPDGVPLDPALDTFVPHQEAVRVVRALHAGDQVGASDRVGRLLISTDGARATAVPLLVSTSIHVAIGLSAALIAGLGYVAADERTELIALTPEPIRLVYLAVPGPGGGGGGGGFRMPSPPPKAERRGERKISSPLPARTLPPPIRPTPKPPEPPPEPLEAKKLPPVMAPVVTAPADQRDRDGVLEQTPKEMPDSQGPGSGTGVGTGKGTGVGEGQGPGLGDGQGGGTGGGPYRPGSGVDPPRLLREVRADYTDEARRAGITGEVLLEIVVRRDGTVGDVRVLRGLGSGLDQRATQAVRQWRFSPAHLKGTPVDVVVEVEVDFKLR
ncbi:MAG: energy transducer TonB [Vicinamibacterales bacterium]